MSIKPGARTKFVASITVSASVGVKLPTSRMRSPRTRTSAIRPGSPVPSTTYAFVKIRSGGSLPGSVSHALRSMSTEIHIMSGKLSFFMFYLYSMFFRASSNFVVSLTLASRLPGTTREARQRRSRDEPTRGDIHWTLCIFSESSSQLTSND